MIGLGLLNDQSGAISTYLEGIDITPYWQDSLGSTIEEKEFKFKLLSKALSQKRKDDRLNSLKILIHSNLIQDQDGALMKLLIHLNKIDSIPKWEVNNLTQ